MAEGKKQIEMPTTGEGDASKDGENDASDLRTLWCCYKVDSGNHEWVVNEQHEDAVAMDDIIDTYDNEYDKKKKSFKFTDSEINHGSKDNDGVEYYVQHVSLEDKNYVVITTMYKTISSIDFETIENNEAKKKEQQDNYTKSREDSNSEESQRFLNTGQLILKQNDIKFKGKGIFLCVCALLVSIAIMSLLEVFVMFFDDDLRNSIAKSQHWENGSEKRNISKKSSTTTTMFRSTLPPVSTTTISAVRTSTTLPLVQPTTSRAPAITSTAQSGTSNLVNGTSNNSSQ